MEIVTHAILHSVEDSLKILPFLFLTYLVMEWIEHKTSNKAKGIIKKSGKFGPLLGGLLGIVPQCGFSAAAASLYAGRIITLGTLIAIFLSTSDEMLPILISEAAPISLIIKILAIKLGIGVFFGFLIDFILRKRQKEKLDTEEIAHMCEHDHCHCEKGIVKSSLKHTLSTFLYILIITFLLNIVIEWIGEDTLAHFVSNQPILGPIIAGIVGLIPNCASSVILTQLFLSNVISAATMIAGLLVGSGVGLLVLFKSNHNIKENLAITVLLYVIAVVCGIVLNLIGLQL